MSSSVPTLWVSLCLPSLPPRSLFHSMVVATSKLTYKCTHRTWCICMAHWWFAKIKGRTSRLKIMLITRKTPRDLHWMQRMLSIAVLFLFVLIFIHFYPFFVGSVAGMSSVTPPTTGSSGKFPNTRLQIEFTLCTLISCGLNCQGTPRCAHAA